MNRPLLLLTNDDGHHAPGFRALRDALRERYDVVALAPDGERSAISMALTLSVPLRLRQVEEGLWTTNGNPTDCVHLAMRQVLERAPQLVVSGMNHGENLSTDVFYSGTVAGAFSGMLYGVTSLAVSMVTRDQAYDRPEYQLEHGVEAALRVVAHLLERPRIGVVHNLNVPWNWTGRICRTVMGNKHYQPDLIRQMDPRGRVYFWTGTGNPSYEGGADTDTTCVRRGDASLSVLAYNLNVPRQEGEPETI